MNKARLLPFNTPLSLGLKGGSLDPRRFISGNDAGEQWDIRQFSSSRAELAAQQPPQYAQAHADRQIAASAVRTVPTRINMVPWQVTQTVISTPMLIIPRNPQRAALLIGNRHATLPLNYWFGPLRKTSAGGNLGLIIPLNGNLLFDGVTCPTDELWCWVDQAGNNDLLAYEGIEAVAGNFT